MLGWDINVCFTVYCQYLWYDIIICMSINREWMSFNMDLSME